MQRQERLTKSSQFVAVQKRGRAWANRLLVLKALSNAMEASRFGFSVSRRVGKAVVRNKVKRRLREAARSANVKGGWDIVVVSRKEAREANYHQLRHSLMSLLERAHLLASQAENTSNRGDQ